MVITDPIADMFMRIRNGGAAGKKSVYIPYSDVKMRIANVLMKEGYLSSVSKKVLKGRNTERVIEVGVVYDAPLAPRVRGMERVSRPSRRMYIGAKNLRPVNQGHGIMILSTPKGILTGSEAHKEHVGGEIIGKVW
jgi:small subunit ribosomal protein S8